MSQLFTNNAQSTLAAAVLVGATSMTLATGQGARFPVLTGVNIGKDSCLLTLIGLTGQTESSWEIVSVTNRTGDVLTVTRAQEGTTAVAWPLGTPIELRLTAGSAQLALAGARTPGERISPLYFNSLAMLDETRILTGPYAGGYRNAPFGYLNVYFAALGLLPFVKDRPVETKAFLTLVMNTLCVVNDGTKGAFTIYDVENLDATTAFPNPTFKVPDSNDSYAAMVLLLSYEYAFVTGDWAWYATNIQRIKDIAYNNLVLTVKPANAVGAGMVRTYQTAVWGAYYNICQTEDNCEVYAALNALSKGLTRLGLTADSTYYGNVRDGIGLGMHNTTFGVWDDVAKNWMVNDQRATVTGLSYYAESITQIFPEVWGVSSGNAATDRQRYDLAWDKLNAYAPQWESNSYNAFPFLIASRAACVRGAYHMAETHVNYILRNSTRAQMTIHEVGWIRRMEITLAERSRSPIAALTLFNNEIATVPVIGQAAVFGKSLAGRTMPAAISASGADTVFQPAIWRQRIARWNPAGNSTTAPVNDGFSTAIILGTATSRAVATTNVLTRSKRLSYAAATSAGNFAGNYFTAPQHTTGDGTGLGGFFYSCRFAFTDPAAVSGARAFVGMTSGTVAPTNADPNAQTNAIGIGQIATDATQLFLISGGSAAQIAVGLGTNFPPMAGTGVNGGTLYDLTIFSAPNANGVVGWRLERVGTTLFIDGLLIPATVGTQTPASTVLLAHRAWRCNNATALAVGIDISHIYIETDY